MSDGPAPVMTGGENGAPVEGAQAGGKRSAWMTHVKKTMRANKGKSLSQVLKMAAKSYKKTAKGGRRHRKPRSRKH